MSYDASAATATGRRVTSELLHAALPEDRVVPVSNTSKIGLVALATGKGYGWLSSGFGITTDSLHCSLPGRGFLVVIVEGLDQARAHLGGSLEKRLRFRFADLADVFACVVNNALQLFP
jgi:hypothetical protein